MNINCKFWSVSDVFFRGQCSAGKFDGRPTFGQCVDLCDQCHTPRSELDAYMATLRPEQPQRPVNFAELKVPAAVASTRLNICGQVCGGLRDKDKCPIGITPCQIKSGKVTECPMGKWPISQETTPHN